MSLAEYQALDLRADGPIAADLSARIAEEALCPTVQLSSSHGAVASSPALFTRSMETWFQTHIAAARVAAIAEVRRGFEQETLGAGNLGFLYEAERDRIERVKQDHLRAERDGFYQSKKIRDRETEIDRLRSEYDRKRSMHGRDAGSWSPWFKHGGVVAIMALEFPLNLSSFLKIDFLTPALATASVFLIAILFAFSSHLIGRLLRQWGERFGANVTASLRADSYRHLAIGIVLFVIGAAAIVFSRSYLVAEALDRCRALGECTNTVSIYGVAFIGNLSVYAAATAWVLFHEDPVPDFAEERRQLDILKGESEKAYRKGLERQQQQRIEQARREREQLDRREAEQAKTLRNYGTCRARFDGVAKQDARVLGLLEGYRSRLVAEARRRGVQTRFTYDDLASGDIATLRELDADDYLGRRLSLGYA